jgi:hypothetical protein
MVGFTHISCDVSMMFAWPPIWFVGIPRFWETHACASADDFW